MTDVNEYAAELASWWVISFVRPTGGYEGDRLFTYGETLFGYGSPTEAQAYAASMTAKMRASDPRAFCECRLATLAECVSADPNTGEDTIRFEDALESAAAA